MGIGKSMYVLYFYLRSWPKIAFNRLEEKIALKRSRLYVNVIDYTDLSYRSGLTVPDPGFKMVFDEGFNYVLEEILLGGYNRFKKAKAKKLIKKLEQLRSEGEGISESHSSIVNPGVYVLVSDKNP